MRLARQVCVFFSVPSASKSGSLSWDATAKHSFANKLMLFNRLFRPCLDSLRCNSAAAKKVDSRLHTFHEAGLLSAPAFHNKSAEILIAIGMFTRLSASYVGFEVAKTFRESLRLKDEQIYHQKCQIPQPQRQKLISRVTRISFCEQNRIANWEIIVRCSIYPPHDDIKRKAEWMIGSQSRKTKKKNANQPECRGEGKKTFHFNRLNCAVKWINHFCAETD